VQFSEREWGMKEEGGEGEGEGRKVTLGMERDLMQHFFINPALFQRLYKLDNSGRPLNLKGAREAWSDSCKVSKSEPRLPSWQTSKSSLFAAEYATADPDRARVGTDPPIKPKP
jgi:hypothetical protein